MNEDKISHYQSILEDVAKHSSDMERRAEEAERETEKLKKAQFMETHIGEVFEGVISGVAGFGMFVELENTCEGMIPAASIEDDFYIYDENTYSLVGERYGKVYTLGQTVKVKVFDTDRLNKTIDFRIVPDESDEGYDDSYDEYEEDYYEEDENGHFQLVSGKKAEKKKGNKPGKKKSIHKKPMAETPAKKRYAKISRLSLLEEEDSGKAKKASKSDKKEKTKKAKDKDAEKSSGRKVYKVHKYKKSATSKAARSSQGNKRKKK
jgi:ribonuclease R